MAHSPAHVGASAQLAALLASDGISDIENGLLGMGALSGSAASPAGSGIDTAAAYMASMGTAGTGAAMQTLAGQQPAAAPAAGKQAAVVKTDQQAALQSSAKQAALSKDKQRASDDVAARPLSASAVKPPILLIHGGAQVRGDPLQQSSCIGHALRKSSAAFSLWACTCFHQTLFLSIPCCMQLEQSWHSIHER